MSNSDFFGGGASAHAVRPHANTPTPAPRSHAWWILGLGILLVGSLLAAVVVHPRGHARDARPVVLPATLMGWPPAPPERQFSDASDWRSNAARNYDGNGFGGRAYATSPPTRQLNLVIVRMDSTAVGDAGMGSEPYLEYGDVRCTRTLRLGGAAAPASSQAMWLLCLRASKDLTVSILALTPVSDGVDTRVAAAVDDVWRLQG